VGLEIESNGALVPSTNGYLDRALWLPDINPALEHNYRQWIAAYPSSYAAAVAYGIYLRIRGYEARGCDYINDTSEQQVAAMDVLLDKAMEQYTRSIPLTQKPILTYHALLGIAMLRGTDETSRAVLESACRIDPRNYIVRYKYLASIQTRWGGSLQKMLQFRQESAQAGLSPQLLTYFDRMIAKERAWLADNR
jgi:hypothetical protein